MSGDGTPAHRQRVKHRATENFAIWQLRVDFQRGQARWVCLHMRDLERNSAFDHQMEVEERTAGIFACNRNPRDGGFTRDFGPKCACRRVSVPIEREDDKRHRRDHWKPWASRFGDAESYINPMGATIHWTLQASKSAAIADASISLGALRQSCLDLPFDYVSDIVCFEAAEISRRLEVRSDPYRWLLLQSAASVLLTSGDKGEVWGSVNPVFLIGFTALAGEKCEPMNCVLARYPEQVVIDRTSVRPGIDGWRGSSFAKTQYASAVTVQHFLKCHLTITAALDAAVALGLVESVVDETGFWENRDLATLVTTIMRWNTCIAGFVGSLELASGTDVQAPIKGHPEFERLEHCGMTGNAAAMAKALAATLKRTSPEE